MKTTKKIILNSLIIVGLLFLINPKNVIAEKAMSKETSGDFLCKNGEMASDKCWNKYGIDIVPEEYKKVASYLGNNKYQNTTFDRKVKITVKDKSVNYGVKIFYGPTGTIDVDDLIDGTDAEDIKIGNVTKKDTEDGVNLASYTIGPDSDKYKEGVLEYSIPDGQDALIIVYLKKNQTLKCIKKSDDKKTSFKCINGRGMTMADNKPLKLKGVSASEFIQNPKNNVYIANLRSPNQTLGNNELKEACRHASNGIYQDSEGKVEKDSKYTINQKNYGDKYTEALSRYKDEMYSPVLGGNYCDLTDVPFNLQENQIVKLSNRLLRTFRKSWKVSKKSSSNTEGSVKSAEEIEQKAKNLAKDLGIELKPKNSANVSVSVDCKDNSTGKYDNKERQEEHFIAYDDQSIVRKLSDGKNYTICKTYCYEHLTVKYDPPVASAAGICFSYQVTVQTTTECGVTDMSEGLLDGRNKESVLGKAIKTMCSPAALCSGSANHTQAGPSEEFDECVRGCDNGKYSQKCINKCYKKVYENNNNSKVVSTTNMKDLTDKNLNFSVSGLELTSENNKGLITNMKYTEDYLKDYWKSNNPKCNSNNVIQNINECSKYYFYAKTLNPCGHFSSDGKKWIQSTTTCELDPNKQNDDISKEIAKSSPFYIRDEESTKNLIIGIINKDNNGHKYRMDKDGIKRSVKSNLSWRCHESCGHSGCDPKKYALSPKQFIDGLKIVTSTDDDFNSKDDIAIIEEALNECNTKAICETTKTSSFKINVHNKRKNSDDTTTLINGSNQSGTNVPYNDKTETSIEPNTDINDNNCNNSENNKFSMFVSERYYDKNLKKYVYIDGEDSNGILGKCYGKNLDYAQYKTTITFPGSWINYKSRKIVYKTNCSGYQLKEGLFCSAYDSENVNEEWWKWHKGIKDSNGNTYSYKNPDTNDNITAEIEKFGEFNWHIKYSCFYAIYNGTGECEDCTRFQDNKFKVIEPGVLFTAGSNQKQGYNWTSAARITENSGVNIENSKALTYTINPQKYIEYINKNETDEKIYNSNNPDDYYIYLSSDSINYIKSKCKKCKRAYAEYDEKDFKEDPNVKGLIRYHSSLLRGLNGQNDIVFTPNGAIDGVNNNYSDLDSLLGK